jgi:hypothetical protein
MWMLFLHIPLRKYYVPFESIQIKSFRNVGQNDSMSGGPLILQILHDILRVYTPRLARH